MPDPTLAKSIADFLGLLKALAVVGVALGLILVPSLLLLRECANSRPGR